MKKGYARLSSEGVPLFHAPTPNKWPSHILARSLAVYFSATSAPASEAFSKLGRVLKKLPSFCADFAAAHTNIKSREKLQSQFQK
jgi:hypothetical protein